jgi:phosphoglycolate phosphatase-like HAD superfamily hydrolase
MTVRHIVWDWNCTLLDDFAITVAAADQACQEVGGTSVGPDAYRRHFTRPVRAFYEALLTRPVRDEEWRRIVVRYHDAYESQVHTVLLRSGAVEALALARDGGLSQSLLSMGEHASVTTMVEAFELNPYFCVVQGADLGDRTASKRDGLLPHVQAVSASVGVTLRPDEVLLVGDTQDDVDAALAAGARCALLSDGCFDAAVAEHPDVTVVDSLHEAVRSGREIATSPDMAPEKGRI